MSLDYTGIRAVASTVRSLTADAVQAANSGHAGMPLGIAELGAALYGEILSHYPGDPAWLNRDRFVLSAGHGSMLLYSLLHLSGYELSLEEIKRFRQRGSKTPGHPEYGQTEGVEIGTGPLGQGFANAVGMAIAERKLAAELNTAEFPIIDHYTYVIAGDGDLMEGISGEAAGLAGHLGLGRLIVFYDSNRNTIDGSIELAVTEDTEARFAACGWQVMACSAYDIDTILSHVKEAKAEAGRPTLIIVDSVIGKGAPSFEGSHHAHGGALGEVEVHSVKSELGIPPEHRYWVFPAARAYFERRRRAWHERYDQWNEQYTQWKSRHPERYRILEQWRAESGSMKNEDAIVDWHVPILHSEGDALPTRTASGRILQQIVEEHTALVGGSADLTVPCLDSEDHFNPITRDSFNGNLLHFGVREHAMAGIANGIAVCGALRPFCATFLAFSDYMRPSMRLAALMKLPVIYVFTHDSVLLGEDGPTHQPVEHAASLRAIPGMTVLRPGDAQETEVAWELALRNIGGPTALLLTRQAVPVYAKESADWRETARNGAYVVRGSEEAPDVLLIASGSEVALALEAIPALSELNVRVVSMLSQELFLSQEREARDKILPPGIPRLYLEAGSVMGWGKILAESSEFVSVDRFGLSAPEAAVAEELGLTSSTVAARVRRLASTASPVQ